MLNLHNRHKSTERKISQKNVEYNVELFFAMQQQLKFELILTDIFNQKMDNLRNIHF
jgi:hypothetical protein